MLSLFSLIDADDFEPSVPKGGSTDKWDGEDEGDDVKVQPQLCFCIAP